MFRRRNVFIGDSCSRKNLTYGKWDVYSVFTVKGVADMACYVTSQSSETEITSCQIRKHYAVPESIYIRVEPK